ncbi:FtsK/SpoIIIE domain-containing protein [Microbacterium oryzae]|uniref:FtsK/SpoIIIE domain-containing protein n=1 Tax=Microbacterium oryzae TaxID=743009 RepID=UPI0025B05908|nr:FtsK/SpoIIIE domain-containing protein [Microbacterium oryzae]MDN3311472.1 FtsK/SpoIIIE domain-containing protein [Microbacterium oryzae]
MTTSVLPRIDEPIALPAPAVPPRPARWPLFAALVPVVGGIAMWLATASVLSLCFAALGPLMALASAVDARRSSRRELRRSEAEYASACARVEAEVDRRHERERQELAARLVGVAALLADAGRVWRAGADELVVGRGPSSSRVRVTGGDGEHADGVRARAGVLEDAPVAVSAAEGVCVRGDPVVARAVARALAVQLCLRASPGELAACPGPEGEEWLDLLPHRGATAPHRLALVLGGAAPAEADRVIAARGPGDPPPDACGAVLEIDGGLRGRLLRGPHVQELALEALSGAQAAALAERLSGMPAAGGVSQTDPPLTLGSLEPVASGEAAALPAVIGAAAGEPAVVDIVGDGPHAVVVGTTGAGKSELLVTWVASLARTYTPERVVFLLADFKGGTAFDVLAHLPHVTGVITDLDAGAARRAVESLRAELRRRETHLAARGLRDVAAPGAGLPRLIIVVDEFAALLHDHADLHAVFTDVAARGRALGMHLVLGTQRSTGVLRDALAANCPLRIALRVAEPAESRGVIGRDDAATLPGGADGRGLAYIRRPSDAGPRLTRVALTAPADVAAIARSADGSRSRGPWLAPLPPELPIDALPQAGPGEVVLGLADDPEHQRQPLVLLRPGADRALAVVGGAGSGKTSLVRLIAEQRRDALLVPSDAEGAWDAVERAEGATGALLLIDDLDALLARFPHDHAHLLAERIEGILRDAGERRSTVVLTLARVAGPAARILDLVARRALLAVASRADHAAAGGESGAFDPRRAPGRGVLDGLEVQLAMPRMAGRVQEPAPTTAWRPTAPVTALSAKAARRRAVALAEGWGDEVRVVVLDDLPPGITLAGLAQPASPVVVAGEPESWQRQWALLQEARSSHPLVVSAECASELRALTGERELPPYARPRASRAWLCVEGRPPQRVVLP